MRPIDFCTPKPFQLEHSYSVVSQRYDRPVRCASFVALRPRVALVPESCGSVLVHANVCSSRAASPVRRRANQAPGGSGPPDANEAGGNRASRRGSHFGDRMVLTRWRFLPPCETDDRPPLTPLSPPPCCLRGLLFFSRPTHWLGGRQDRFRGGLVKGVRFADPGCLPPADATHTPPAPKHGRNCAAFIDRRGAHVMRIAELR